jgi:hypothetical protein
MTSSFLTPPLFCSIVRLSNNYPAALPRIFNEAHLLHPLYMIFVVLKIPRGKLRGMRSLMRFTALAASEVPWVYIPPAVYMPLAL